MADLQRKFLNSLGKNVFPMVSFIITASIYPFLCWHLAIELKMGMVGMAICSNIMNLATLLLMILMSYFDKEIQESMLLPDRSSVTDLQRYLSIGAPNILQTTMDNLSYEVLTLSSGLMGVKEQAT